MVHTGLDRLLARPDTLRNRSVGLVANHTSVSSGLGYSWDLMAGQGINIKKVFSPEHGLFGTEQDQIPVSTRIDFPFEVINLYGNTHDTLAPAETHLAGLDTIVYDIQDIGTRYYTYVNTMVLFLKAVHSKDIDFMVLDRPNPLGGLSVEGPVLKKGYESFVGLLPVPVRHGLTAGEIARLAIDYFKLDVNLHLIEMTGWTRDMLFDETGLTWVPPSPNMPSLNTAFVYPGACLFEGTSVSEGRGTTTPFEVIGAPGVLPTALCERLNAGNLPGIHFRPVYFKPTFNKYSGETIGGAFIHVLDRGIFKPFLTGIAMVLIMREMMPGFEFYSGVYEFNDIHPAFDLLTGGPAVREHIIDGKPLDLIADLWEKEEKVFAGITEEYHIYQV
jgi:uncharacterized protein YbbC (DUF1343 family)